MPSPESACISALRAACQRQSRWRKTILAGGLALALVVASLLLMVSCQSDASPTPGPTMTPTAAATAAPVAAKVPQPVKIVFWHTQRDDSPGGKLLAQMAQRFHQEYPWITVEPAYVGNYDDLAKKVVAAIQAGNPPGVAAAHGSSIAEFIKAGALVPLAPYIADPQIGLADDDREDIFPGYWDAGLLPEFDNQMFSFPFSEEALALYYNRKALQAAGLAKPPSTWAEFEQACLKTTRGDVRGFAGRQDALTFTGWLYSLGASLLNSDQSKALFDGAEGVELLETWNRLLGPGAAWKPAEEGGDRLAFANGKAVFTLDLIGQAPNYAQAVQEAGSAVEWGCTIIPQREPARPRTVLSGANLCVFRTDEARQQAAWLFIRWLTATDQTAAWGQLPGQTPIRRSAVKKLADSGWLEQNPLAKEIFETVIPYAYPAPNVRGAQEIGEIIAEAWAAAAAGTETPQQALSAAAAKANATLAAKR